MKLFKITICFLTLVTACIASDTQSVIYKEVIPETNKIIEKSNKNVPNNSESKESTQQPPVNYNNDPSIPQNRRVLSSRPKHKQIPLVNAILPLLPMKLPVATKTPKTVPSTIQKIPIKTDPNGSNNFKAKNYNTTLKEVTPDHKLTHQGVVYHKDTTASSSHTSKNDETESAIYKPKTLQLSDYDTGTSTLLPPKTQKNITESVTTTNQLKTNLPTSSFNKEFKKNVNKIIQIGDDFEAIDNGTHCFYIKKLEPPPEISKTNAKECLKAGDSTANEEANSKIDSNRNYKGLDVSLTRTAKDIVDVEIKNSPPINDNSDTISDAVQRPINTAELRDDLSGSISITNHNYEEIEERSDNVYPELSRQSNKLISQWRTQTPMRNFNTQWSTSKSNRDVNTQWSTSIPNLNFNTQWSTPRPNLDFNTQGTTSANPFINYYQDYKSLYQQYSPRNTDNNDNCYALMNIPNAETNNTPDNMRMYSYPYANQIVQDRGRKPKYQNVIAQIPLDRIWRLWKDTEIKIDKPKRYDEKPKLAYSRNINRQNIGETLAPYRNQVNGLYGYYNNLNKPIRIPSLN